MLRRKERFDSYIILQKNIRAWCTLRTWEWYKLYGKVKPLFKSNKHEEDVERLESELRELETSFNIEEEKRKLIEIQRAMLLKKNEAILKEINIICSDENMVENEVHTDF